MPSNYGPASSEASSQTTPAAKDPPSGPQITHAEGFPAHVSSGDRQKRAIDSLGQGYILGGGNPNLGNPIPGNGNPNNNPVKTPHHHYGNDQQIRDLKQKRNELSSQIGELRAKIEDIENDPKLSRGQKNGQIHVVWNQISKLQNKIKKIDADIAKLETPSNSRGLRFYMGTRYR
jgi:chorismate mutase